MNTRLFFHKRPKNILMISCSSQTYFNSSYCLIIIDLKYAWNLQASVQIYIIANNGENRAFNCLHVSSRQCKNTLHLGENRLRNTVCLKKSGSVTQKCCNFLNFLLFVIIFTQFERSFIKLSENIKFVWNCYQKSDYYLYFDPIPSSGFLIINKNLCFVNISYRNIF